MSSVYLDSHRDTVLPLEMKSPLLEIEQWLSKSLCAENGTT